MYTTTCEYPTYAHPTLATADADASGWAWLTDIVVAVGVAVIAFWVGTSPFVLAAAHGGTALPRSVTAFVDIPFHDRLYRASLVPSLDPVRPNDPLRWTVTVVTAAGTPVSDATLSLESRMPTDSAVAPLHSLIGKYLGEGRYEIKGMRFPHSGWWNVTLQISGRRGTDSLAFNADVRGRRR